MRPGASWRKHASVTGESRASGPTAPGVIPRGPFTRSHSMFCAGTTCRSRTCAARDGRNSPGPTLRTSILSGPSATGPRKNCVRSGQVRQQSLIGGSRIRPRVGARSRRDARRSTQRFARSRRASRGLRSFTSRRSTVQRCNGSSTRLARSLTTRRAHLSDPTKRASGTFYTGSQTLP